jgi:hypothetical protein
MNKEVNKKEVKEDVKNEDKKEVKVEKKIESQMELKDDLITLLKLINNHPYLSAAIIGYSIYSIVDLTKFIFTEQSLKDKFKDKVNKIMNNFIDFSLSEESFKAILHLENLKIEGGFIKNYLFFIYFYN